MRAMVLPLLALTLLPTPGVSKAPALKTTAPAEGRLVTLQNDELLVVFDRASGALVRLVARQSGWEIERRAKLARSFRLLIPLPERRDNPVLGEAQPAPELDVDADGRGVSFLWRHVRGQHSGPLEIDFRGRARFAADGGLVFDAEIVNHSPYVVEAVHWPLFGDLNAPEGCARLAQLGLSYGGMQTHELAPRFSNERGYYGVDWPTQMMMTPDTPFSLIDCRPPGDGPGQGLYVGYHDTTAEQLVAFTAELHPGYLGSEFWGGGVNQTTDEIDGQAVLIELAPVHFAFVAPGSRGRLAPIVLQPYRGSWHAGADFYKRWRGSWFGAPRRPAWLDEVHAWQQIRVNSAEDDRRYRYSDLATIAEDCARHGVKAVQITGWNLGGQDRGNPLHDTDPALGTWEELRLALAGMRERGVMPVLFNKYTWVDRSQPYYPELLPFTIKDPYGAPYFHPGYQYQTPTQLADINTRRFAPLCHLSAGWRRRAVNELEKSVRLGAAGILYDENQHHGGARYCFDPGHGHGVPAHVYAGDALLAEDFRAMTGARSQEFFYAGEGCYDLEMRHYALSYFRIDLSHVPMHRYVAPNEQMMIAVSGYDDRNAINQALLYRYVISYEPRNFKGRLEEFPLTLGYGKRVDALRRRYPSFLWKTEFRHTVGARVVGESGPTPAYSVFLEPGTGRRAVVLANFDYGRETRGRVALEGPARPLVMATPEQPEATKADGQFVLSPRSALVMMEE